MSSKYSSKTNISEDESGIENVTFWGGGKKDSSQILNSEFN